MCVQHNNNNNNNSMEREELETGKLSICIPGGKDYIIGRARQSKLRRFLRFGVGQHTGMDILLLLLLLLLGRSTVLDISQSPNAHCFATVNLGSVL